MLWMVAMLAHGSPLAYPMEGARVVDVDGDGWDDVVVGADGVHYGTGAGFTGITPLTKRREALWSVFGDLDGDGSNDVCRWEWNHLWCYAMSGRTLGTLLLDVPAEVRSTHMVDADGDGDVDLLVTGESQIDLYRNDGSGQLVPELWHQEITTIFLDADVDGDGLVDLVTWSVYGRELYWSRRDAVTGLAPPVELLTGISAAGIYGFADAVGDPTPDMLSVSAGFPIYVRQGGVPTASGFGQLQAMEYSGAFSLVDLEGLGRTGLLVADGDTVWWDADFDGTGVPVHTLVPRVPGANYVGVSLPYAFGADGDGDGDDDLVVSDVDLSVVLDPLGVPDEHVLQAGTDTSGAIAVGDIDRDGLVDVLYSDGTSGSAWWVPGVGDGAFGAAVEAPFVGASTQLALVDVSGDGAVDLVGVTDAGGVGARLGDGAGAFGVSVGTTEGARQARGQVVDVDGDGVDEWVVARIGGGLLWADDDGAGQLAWTPWAHTDVFRSLAAGDLGGDGSLELVGLTLGGDVVVLGTGATGLVELDRVPAPGREPFEVYLADRDGDGAAELLVHGECDLTYVYGVYAICETDQLLYTATGAPGALSGFVETGEIDAPVRVGPWLQPDADALLGIDGVVLAVFDAAHQATMLDERHRLADLALADLDGDGDLDGVLLDFLGLRALWGGPVTDGLPALVDSSDTGLAAPETGDTVDTGSSTTLPTGSTADTAAIEDTAILEPAPTDTGADTRGSDTGSPSTPGGEDDSRCGCTSVGTASIGWLGGILAVGWRRRR